MAQNIEYQQFSSSHHNSSRLSPTRGASFYNVLHPQVESPDNVEMGGRIESIQLCIAPLWKTIVRYLLYLCTGFLFYLPILWFPKFEIFMSLKESHLPRANKIIIHGGDENLEIVDLIEETTSKGNRKVFHYRFFKYYYEENENIFKPCQFEIEKLSYNEIHELYGRGQDDNAVEDNKVIFGNNLIDIPKRSCLTVLIEEVLSPFYVFQIFSFTVWSFDDYSIYGYIIFFSSVISILFTLYETVTTERKLRDMSYYEIPVTVYRKINGEPTKMTINSTEIVPGDLMEIPDGYIMPCDCVVLNGSCIMNESMLTGESIPVAKYALPYHDLKYSSRDDKQHTLYAGTKCIQTRYYEEKAVLGLVTLTGFSTVKGDLIRTMLFPKPSDFKFYSDAFKFMGILLVLAVCGFLFDLPGWLNYTPQEEDDSSRLEIILVKAGELITVTVPPALPTCIQIGIAVGLARLRKKKIYCISPNKINEAGRVNVMCFDKTGTLTEEGLDLLGVRPVFFDKNTKKLGFTKLINDPKKLSANISEERREAELKNYMLTEASMGKNSVYKKSQMFPSEQMLEIMATCHSLTMVEEDLIGDPLDLQMFRSTHWLLDENNQENYDALVLAVVKPPAIQSEIFEEEETEDKDSFTESSLEIGIIRRFEFSSKLQRMSVIVRNLEQSGFKVHIKGAPEKIRELCRPETIPDNFHYILEKYTQYGCRVLACATKATSLNYMKLMSATREAIEKEFTFMGFIVMENRLKPATTGIIDLLHQAEIKTIMVTGDNALTAISVARQCNIVGQNQRIFLGDLAEKQINGKDVIDWKDFDYSEWTLNNDLIPDMEYGSKLFDDGSIFWQTRASQQNVATAGLNMGQSLADELLNPSLRPSLRENLLSPKIRFSSDFNRDRKNSMASQRIPSDSMANVEVSAPFYNMREYDDYCIAVTGKAFSLILREVEENENSQYQVMLEALLKKCVIFARMHPDEKALMIKHLMGEKGNVVGMCGDGANDIGALKTANVGVSLSQAEASIAAPFTSNIQDISCIPTLLTEGRAALVTSYQEFKYMALYSIIQFSGVTLLYHYNMDFTNWAYYHVDIFIVLSLSGTMALTSPYNELTKALPAGRLISVQILTSVIFQMVLQISFQYGTFFLLTQQPWYNPDFCKDNFNLSWACPENSTLYIVSIYQYCIVALAFMVGKPFKKAFYTNFWFTTSLALLLVANFLATYNPLNWPFLADEKGDTPSVYNFDTTWRNTLMIIIIFNSLLTLMWEFLVVKYVAIAWKSYRTKKQMKREAEENTYQPPRVSVPIITSV